MLVVTAGPVTEVVSVSTLREHCRIVGTGDDGLLASFIKTARRDAETLTERLFGVQTLRLTMPAFPAGGIELSRPPTAAVASVEYRDATGAWQTIDAGDYDVDLQDEPGSITPAEAWPADVWQGGGSVVRVIYTAGYSFDTCPEEVKAYICLRAASLYENREADSDKPAMPLPFAERLLDGVRRWHS